MEKVKFFKFSGCGNDFIIIDNRDQAIDEKILPYFIANTCQRKMSVGADGLILVEDSEAVDFRWRFFNSDGSHAEMCGNGARCVARFAFLNGIAGSEMAFETGAGIVSARVYKNRVKLKMPDPSDLKTGDFIELNDGPLSICSINTGVPHALVWVDEIDDVDVVQLGREIRFHKQFAPAGTNVNFICDRNGNLLIRTYERGVEDETLACGTGAVAGALVLASKFEKQSPIDVMMRSGGCLTIHFSEKAGEFYDIYLEGDARLIYKGELGEEAWH